jgi:hypothetical protein
MIKYLKHHKINKEKWDKAVENSQFPLIYAMSWYLDRVCPGWEAIVDRNYKSVFPLTRNRKFGIHYLYQPFFTQQLGLFSTKKSTDLIEFINKIPDKYKFVQISLNESNLLPEGSWKEITNQTYHLDLDKEIDEIREAYSENTKRNLKKAQKHELKVVKNDRFSDLIRLFRENRGGELKNLKDRHFITLLDVMEESHRRDSGCAYSVYTEKGEYCAGAFFLESFDRFIFLFSATDNVARKNGAMVALIDHFIKQHCNRKVILDFEGSNLRNLARFYGGFGAKSVEYKGLIINRLPKAIRWLK